ncbi:hypothetical protein ACHAWX_000756 [Stephanocyclus meneghinianus]
MMSVAFLALLLVPIITPHAFMVPISHVARRQRVRKLFRSSPPLPMNLRSGGIDDDFDADDDESYIGNRQTYASNKRYQDNVEFFDLDDEDDYEDVYERGGDYSDALSNYNGIIPNPLLDAMDPDGVYERLGPELFKDWTFWRDMVLFAAFLALFTRDTHHYGTFDSVVEGLERLPSNFIPM